MCAPFQWIVYYYRWLTPMEFHVSSYWRMKKHQQLWISDFINKIAFQLLWVMRYAVFPFSFRSVHHYYGIRETTSTQVAGLRYTREYILKYTLNQNWSKNKWKKKISFRNMPNTPKRKTDQIQMQIKVFTIYFAMNGNDVSIADPIELSSKQEGFLYVYFFELSTFFVIDSVYFQTFSFTCWTQFLETVREICNSFLVFGDFIASKHFIWRWIPTYLSCTTWIYLHKISGNLPNIFVIFPHNIAT